MVNYILLANPGHNRVYFEESKKLSISELKIALMKLSVCCADVKTEYIADVFYISFTCDDKLGSSDMEKLSRLSFIYAVFEVRSVNGEKLLLPIAKRNMQYIDQNISSILKYTGKTNELFTRLMINIALFSSDHSDSKDINLLDPLAGKCTTLFEGLINGYNVYGIEIGEKIVNEAYHYLKKYLETEKYKHTAEIIKTSGDNKAYTATRYMFEIAKTKEEIKSNEQKIFEIISGNSIYAGKFYKKNFFHIIVGDLPYGVQHGNVTNEKQSSLTRNPKELLNACLEGWRSVLMIGGSMVLAWNSFVMPRDEMVGILSGAGFEVLCDDVYLQFKHRVDQAIMRDIVVAKKTR